MRIVPDHREGTTRVLGYCPNGEKRVLCFDVYRKPDVKGRMKRIRQYTKQNRTPHSVIETPEYTLIWSFLASHRYDADATAEVLHIGCKLHVPWAPSTDDDEGGEVG